VTDLTALLGSRICHDLISPLGAIGNGVELMMMTPGSAGPELALISESVTNANARIRFFRIAFGASAAGQSVSRAEVRSILDDMTRGGRLTIDWGLAEDQARRDVKLFFLLIQCLEVALAYGGQITLRPLETGPGWQIAATAARMKIDPALWSRLSRRDASADLEPAQVQFALAAQELADRGLVLTPAVSDTSLTMHVTPQGRAAVAPASYVPALAPASFAPPSFTPAAE
jgi:histidine phosphotransferase ChpT